MPNTRTEHTPGPLLVQRKHDGDYTVWTRQPHTGTVATVHAEDINGEFPARDNAHLFAAAPELLALLAEADRRVPWESVGLGNDFSDRVEAAIAKARGAA